MKKVLVVSFFSFGCPMEILFNDGCNSNGRDVLYLRSMFQKETDDVHSEKSSLMNGQILFNKQIGSGSLSATEKFCKADKHSYMEAP